MACVMTRIQHSFGSGLLIRPTTRFISANNRPVQQLPSPVRFAAGRGQHLPRGADPNYTDKIGDLKRGAEIVVCTPGRMIDILCANKGRITNLQRVSFYNNNNSLCNF